MTFIVPIEDRYFEDYVPGDIHEFGCVEVEEAQMIAFARRFDPQPLHTDPEVAKQSPFGNLIASGWYTVSLTMRVLVDHYVSRAAGIGSPGVDELRWFNPVRAGDTLFFRATILEAKLSRSKPDRGIVRSYVEVRNQHSEVVMTWKGMDLIRCREAEVSTVMAKNHV